MSALMQAVDAGRLIDEVKKRPGLYDKVIDIDKDEKMTLWKEVGAIVYKDWSSLTKAEAYDRVLELQRKWRSVRDALNRELRMRKASNKRHRKVYKYYHKLRFLVKDDKHADEGDANDDNDDEDNCYENDDNSRLEASQNEDQEDESDPLHNHGKISVRKKLKQRDSSPERQLLPIHFQNDDIDSDRLFLMSFVPELSKLPPHINMWARAEIANVMQQAVSCYYNNSVPEANYAGAELKRQKINDESIL